MLKIQLIIYYLQILNSQLTNTIYNMSAFESVQNHPLLKENDSSKTTLTIINDYDILFNKLYEINTSDLIMVEQLQIPISNKYYVMLFDNKKEKMNNFLNYIFDVTREKEINFTLDEKINTKIEWEKEQFYFIEPEKTNIFQLDKDFLELKDVIEESNAQLCVIIDIDYVISFIDENKKLGNQTHLYDYLIEKISNFKKISTVILFNEKNIDENNILFEQIKTKFMLDYVSPFAENKIVVYKSIDDQELNLYWNILQNDDVSIKIKNISNELEENVKQHEFYLGIVNNKECFVAEVLIKNIIENNIFTLEKNPGIVIDTIDLVNYKFT